MSGNAFLVELDSVPDHPEYCGLCGRLLVAHREPSGYDPATGERTFIAYRDCPRFARSWRNFWLGGWGHTSRFGTIGSREWQ